ncbi:ANM_HP_G0212810.mRNA.1.CDS.1 [Saccharomyces cerevisiae]|nr:ANM_HP_G0212810.mRNA.1.CDS.1 [Saccharomyces cerevisiae]CAI6972680.1 ANM_HP_G0212810.mRNA.1.CDS.1 [Saccharomyces cerevisiae]
MRKSTTLTDNNNKPFSARYVGSMVAYSRDVSLRWPFRIPLRQEELQRKTEILYEAFPMAFLMVKAGSAVNVSQRTWWCQVISMTNLLFGWVLQVKVTNL